MSIVRITEGIASVKSASGVSRKREIKAIPGAEKNVYLELKNLASLLGGFCKKHYVTMWSFDVRSIFVINIWLSDVRSVIRSWSRGCKPRSRGVRGSPAREGFREREEQVARKMHQVWSTSELGS